MPLADELKQALKRLNFEKPTQIQDAVIEMAASGQDVIACAETGSGKTAAYGIPMIERLLADESKKSLILAPTRELVQQIANVIRDLTTGVEGFKIASLVGGSDMSKQIRAIKRKPRMIVATPGRLNDHLRRGTLKLKNVQTLALDEGDRMLDMGFAPQLDDILKHLPEKRQTLLFTATLPPKVKTLAQKYLNKPKEFEVGRTSLPVEAIKQSICEITNKQKPARIVDELNAREGSIIVFMRTKTRVDDLTRTLKSFGFRVESIHGDKTQGQRNKAIRNFRDGKSRILVATDIAARGLDVPEVAHVINYDLPRMDEDYVHRIGRTARNGAEGEALSFVTPSDQKAWMLLVKKYKIPGCNLENYNPEDHKKQSKKSRSRSGFAGRKRKSFGSRRGGDSSEDSHQKKRYSKKSSSGKKFGSKKSGTGKKFGSKKSSSGGGRKFGAKKSSGSSAGGSRKRAR